MDDNHRKAFDPERVEEFLETGGGLLGDLAGQSLAEDEQTIAARWIGRELGAYRISEYLDRGGMALVFRARRCDGQFEQDVAIKLLRQPDSQEFAQRFVREQQFLARLKHPGIAHIIDSGVVDGQPWIAMELVEGVPIDRYCDERQLSLAKRLQLFILAARAVQFAHGQLVIHRDLKPSNILVSRDGDPKLLDFGIAKALEGPDGDVTGQAVLLTPLYASPEQVLGNPVGVASDIYQLGLLLYRLLTGCDAQAMESTSVADIKAVVIDHRPVSPSSRIQTTTRRDSTLSQHIARCRDISPIRLSRKLSGDLDAVVLQALHKDPEDRYATVEQLICDVENYLASRPVVARRATGWYRVRKFTARHRGGVLAALLTTLVLIASAVTVALSWRTTIKAQRVALAEAEGAKEVGKFLSDMLSEANPVQSGGDELTVRELLESSASRLDSLEDQPRVRARLLEVVAGAFESLALPEMAEPLAIQALTAWEQLNDEAATVEPLALLAMIRMQQGQLEEALDYGQRAVAIATAQALTPTVQARAHDALANVYFQRGEYAAQRVQLELAIAALDGLEDKRSVRQRSAILMNLGSNSRQSGNYETALQEFGASLSLLGSSPQERVARMFTLRELGILHSNLSNEAMAVQQLQDSLELARTIYGDNNANILGNLVLLGRSLGNLNRLDEAERLFTEALAVAEETIGRDHGNYARILHDYAHILRRKGDFAAVRRVRGEAVGIAEKFFGVDHSTAVNLRKALAFVELDEGRYQDAVDAFTGVLPAVRETFGVSHMITFETAAGLAEALMESGNSSAARQRLMDLVQSGQTIADGAFFAYHRNFSQLSRISLLTGTENDAVTFANRSVSLRQAMVGDQDLALIKPLAARALARTVAGDLGAQDDIDRVLTLLENDSSTSTLPMNWFLTDLATTLARADRLTEALRLCEKALPELAAKLTEDHPIRAYGNTHCAEVFLRSGQPAAAVQLLDLSLPVVADVLGTRHWRTLWARALLAAASNQPADYRQATSELQQVLGLASPMLTLLP